MGWAREIQSLCLQTLFASHSLRPPCIWRPEPMFCQTASQHLSNFWQGHLATQVCFAEQAMVGSQVSITCLYLDSHLVPASSAFVEVPTVQHILFSQILITLQKICWYVSPKMAYLHSTHQVRDSLTNLTHNLVETSMLWPLLTRILVQYWKICYNIFEMSNMLQNMHICRKICYQRRMWDASSSQHGMVSAMFKHKVFAVLQCICFYVKKRERRLKRCPVLSSLSSL